MTSPRGSSLTAKDCVYLLYWMTAGGFLSFKAAPVPAAPYFDEPYYVASAEQYLKGVPGPSVPFFPVEWTHPPLVKLIFAASILAEGRYGQHVTPLMWRMPNVIIGALLIGVTYVLCKLVLRSTTAANLASALITFDGFRLVQSKIATPEIFLAFSATLVLVLTFKICHTDRSSRMEAWLLSIGIGLSAGCMLATKWSGIVVLCFVIAYIARVLPAGTERGHPSRLTVIGTICLVCLLVYVGSYAPQLRAGWSIRQVASLQVQMYEYHSNLTKNDPESVHHAYASRWWQWPTLLAPVVYYFADNTSNSRMARNRRECCVAEIIALPNPISWWLTLLVLILLLFGKIRFTTAGERYVLMAYGVFLLPWAFSPRVDFFYNFFPALPLVSIINAKALLTWWESSENRPYVIGVCAAVLICFVYFLPVLQGQQIPRSSWESRMWLDNWLRWAHLGHLRGASWIQPN